MDIKDTAEAKKLTVAFIPRRSRIRPYKMAKALKYTGQVRLILICEESFYDEELFEDVFDKVYFFTKKNFLFKLPKAEKIYRRLNERIGFGFKKMIRIINEVDPDLLHCFAEPYNHIAHVIKNSQKPVVMSDGADFTGITQGLNNVSQKDLKLEKYCFENVAGIVHKGPKFEIDFYISNGYKINCPDLTFMDYCDDDLIIEKAEKLEGMHIVYTGNISTNPANKYIYYLNLAEKFSDQQIHFHIYPNPYQYHHASNYRELDKVNHYFHFHNPISYKSVSKEIAKYHWGLWWHDPSGGNRIDVNKRKVAIGNKLFTYIEAGLPTIIGSHNGHGRKIIEERNIGLTVDLLDFDDIYPKLKKDYNLKRLNVRKASIEFKISGRGPELLAFYNKIINEIELYSS